VGFLRSCVAKLIEVNERVGYREEEWGVVTGRWDGGCGNRLVGVRVSNFGYVNEVGMVVVVVGVGGCNGSVHWLEMYCGREA
jgi:hypothetical protein